MAGKRRDRGHDHGGYEREPGPIRRLLDWIGNLTSCSTLLLLIAAVMISVQIW